MPPTSLATACRTILETAEPYAKLRATRAMARDWRAGRLDWRFDVAMPERPTRGDRPELLAPGKMPKRRRGVSEAGRIALLHALAHIECVAIDLAVDMIGRFGAQFPREFVDDWMRVAAEEALHFAILDRRLRQLGVAYGDLPAHDGLWESAEKTSGDVVARLAIVPLVLEARGLDVTPATVERLEANGDIGSARRLDRIYRDEIVHVSIGTRWFRFACDSRRIDPVTTWRKLVGDHFKRGLKPPFNDSARAQAGLTPDYYAAVA